jgi:hypothetical protein
VLATVLAGLPSEVSASVLGSDRDVCHRIAATRPGTEVVVVPRRHRLSPWTWLTLRSALARLRPDVVHVNSTWPLSSVEMLFALQLLRSPVAVAHEHLPMPLASSLHRLLKRLLSRRLDAHVVVGERAGQELAGLHRPVRRRVHGRPERGAAVRRTTGRTGHGRADGPGHGPLHPAEGLRRPRRSGRGPARTRRCCSWGRATEGESTAEADADAHGLHGSGCHVGRGSPSRVAGSGLPTSSCSPRGSKRRRW